MRRILGITGIRSDYDLMSVLYRRLAADGTIDFRVMVGGAHLSRTYGYSIQQILDDKIPILASIESLIDADTRSARLKTASIMLQSAIDSVASWKPDLLLYAGDREEVWIGAILGAYLEVPTVHFYGGDHTDAWHVDNVVRHAVSKLSTFHVVSTQEHRARLLAIGEPDNRIRVIGSLALDNFVAQTPMQISELSARVGLPGDIGDYAMVVFHPDPSEHGIAGEICRTILRELKAADLGACIGYPNTDPANKEVIDAIDEFRKCRRVFCYKSLARSDFISIYKGSKFIIGNSSSGIIEAASIPLPAINVGQRQRGRYAERNVIFVDTAATAVRDAIAKAQNAGFRESLRNLVNPYGDGNSCAKAYDLIVNANLEALRAKTEDPLVVQLKRDAR